MEDRWVNLINGVPTVSNFTTTRGNGAPLCLDIATGRLYYLAPGDVVTRSGLTLFDFHQANFGSNNKLNFLEIGGSGNGIIGIGADDVVTHFPYFSLATDDGSLFGIFGTFTANSRIGLAGNVAWEFTLQPYVGTNQIWHAGNFPASTGIVIPEGTAASVSTPAAGKQALFIDSADHKLKRKDSSGTVTVIA